MVLFYVVTLGLMMSTRMEYLLAVSSRLTVLLKQYSELVQYGKRLPCLFEYRELKINDMNRSKF